MNANELADELENTDEGSGYLGVLSLEAATMLRQQHAEIEELKKKKEHWESQYIIENKKWKFAEKSFSDLLMRAVNNTNPVKELTKAEGFALTDEEIQLLMNDVPEYDISNYDLFEFAKAILRKAQENG